VVSWFQFFRSNKQLTAKLWRLVHACHIRGLCSIACATIPDCVEKRVNHVEKGSLTGNGLAGNGNVYFVPTGCYCFRKTWGRCSILDVWLAVVMNLSLPYLLKSPYIFCLMCFEIQQ
jgi:hypothetical protein